MAVGDFGFVEEGVEGCGHDDWMLRAGLPICLWNVRGEWCIL